MKILILQTAFIGDVILAVPLIEGVFRKYPGAEISFLTIPYSAPVLMNHPQLTETLVFDKRGGNSLRNTLEMVKTLKRRKFDLAIVPHRSLRSAVMVWAAGIPRRNGFGRSAGNFLFSNKVEYRKDWHEVKRNLSLIGMEEESIAPRIYPGEKEMDKTEEFLRSAGVSGGFTAMAPGSIWETKKWPEEYYRELCASMKERGMAPVVLTGGPKETGVCRKVAEGLEGYVHIAAGRLNPLESAALISKAAVMIANDSAAGHIAAAVSTPVVSIFGPTVPGFGFAPYGEKNAVIGHPDLYCRPCRIHGSRKCPEKHFRCMLEVKPERVLEEVLKFL
ncbi:MAG: lipopolysaccharide heptosyltransferase II [FCB group bacterium]|nr:lipopolysaccharide heptosyltransferase II [FCB group bacterium]